MRSTLAMLALVAALAGCSGATRASGPSTSGGSSVSTITSTSPTAPFDFEDAIAALSRAGANIQFGEHASGVPFSVDQKIVEMGSYQIRGFEYEDAQARIAEEATITMDGSSVNHTPVEWTSDPHYWSRGRVIVLYLGSETPAIDLLTRALGPEIDIE